jgi:hypothetical protein
MSLKPDELHVILQQEAFINNLSLARGPHGAKMGVSVICTWKVYCLSDIDVFFLGWCMVFNATFNNISVISGRSVLLVEKTTDFNFPFYLKMTIVTS